MIRTVDEDLIEEIVRRLIAAIDPDRIILFGSRARGDSGPDSDIDLLIIKDTRLSFAERARRVSQIIGRHVFPLDLIVLTPGEVQRRLKAFDPFLEEALSHGRILYDKNG